MLFPCPTLAGTHIRLEPLSLEHVEGLAAASAIDPSLYDWSAVPQGIDAVRRYVETTVAQRDAGTAAPFATVRMADNTIVGCTRFFDLERWAWSAGHPRAALTTPDVGEIGGTWLSASAVRTAANTEAKLLMLTHAFETWDMLRICFHTDARNDRSAAAIERIGGRFEGILRAHRFAVDHIPRNSKRYSITAAEWPQVKAHLQHLLASHGPSTT
jgi:RimJ/RimL family protein N-acetyltransferase